jgi:Ca2+-binding EF-hand superfamily protein
MSTFVRTLVGTVALAVGVFALTTGGRTSGVRANDKVPPAGQAADPEAVRDVFLLLDGGPLHIRLTITIGGKSPQAVRREYLARLFKALDTDGDGKLTRAEFERSPLNTSRRGAGSKLSAKEAAETVPAAKLAEALERVAGETLAFRQDNTARKTDDNVFAALDTNHDGVLSEDEILAAPDLLLLKDTDDDDCLTIDEFTPPEPLQPRLVVPGAPPDRPTASASTMLVDGTNPLFGPRLIRRYDQNRDGKLSPQEINISPERFKALDTDGDGKLSAEELKAFHKQRPDVEASIELEPPAGQSARIALAPGSTARIARPDVAVFGLTGTDVALAVRSFDPVKSALADAQQQFNRLDVDQNGYLDRDELKDNIRFQRGLFEAIDTDGNDMIFWDEMEAYVRSRAEASATRCDIVLHDLGHGFFEALDRNHDGRIGLREIRAASETLRALRKPGQTVLRATDPSRRLHLEVIRGSFQLFGTGTAGESTVPRLTVQPRTPVGPLWFQRMDRNQDGDLTWKEFLGPRHVFEELDLNHDGLIDPEEAEKAAEKFK